MWFFLLQPPKLKAGKHSTPQRRKLQKTVGLYSEVSQTIEQMSDWIIDKSHKEDLRSPAGPSHAENNSKNSEDTVVPAAVSLYEPISDDDDSLFNDLWEDNSSPDDSSEVDVAETHSKSGTKCSLCQFCLDSGL